MRKHNQLWIGATAFGVAVLVGTVGAQVGRGGSEWLTAHGDAQRTSWIRTDPKISVESMSKPGFELQWSAKLDNRSREMNGLAQGVSANGVTLFVPMSIVTGSSNNVYALDNDTGYVVWQRTFDAAMPAPTAACPGGITAAATRIVPLMPPPIAAPAPAGGGRATQSYRSVIGEPGMGVPLEARGRGPAPAPPAARGGQNAPGAPGAAGPPAAPPATPPGAPAGQPQRQGGGGGFGGGAPVTIPGATTEQMGGGRGGLGRPSGVVYAVSSDGMLHVLGLPSGKDIQRPAQFVPANARWSDLIAVNTTLYATTSGSCAGAPNAVWAIDLESASKPAVSWKAGDGQDLVGAVAFTIDGTAIVARSNAIVALDGKTLQEKDSFTDPSITFVTGPTLFGHNGKEIVAAGTKDGRIVLLDAASLGGASHSTPLYASAAGLGSLAADALTTWQEMTVTAAPTPAPGATPPQAPATPLPPIVTLGTRWILAPLSTGVVALKLEDSGGKLSLAKGWQSPSLTAPATPVVVNGVVFTLSKPAVLQAFDGKTGKALYTSQKTMTSASSPRSFWSAMGQVYVGSNDGTLYAFGFVDERR